VPTQEIVRIVDGLRSERERYNKDPVRSVAPEASGQLRHDMERVGRPSEEQDASWSVDLDPLISIEQATPPPSLNQKAPARLDIQ
jgi:hypothetical protein